MPIVTEMILCPQCKRSCEMTKVDEYLQEVADKSVRIRGECPHCGKFLKFMKFAESELVKKILVIAYQERLVCIYEDREENEPEQLSCPF